MGLGRTTRWRAGSSQKYLLAERPNAKTKVGVLYQQGDFGSDHLDPFLAAFGNNAESIVVALQSYGATAPDVASQIISIHEPGRRHALCHGAKPHRSVGGAHARDIPGWNTLIFMPDVATAKSIARPLGAKPTGVMSIGGA